MDKPIRILHYIPGFSYGGIESRFFDWYDRIDRKKIQFDLLIQTDKNNPIFDDFKRKGGRVFQVGKISLRNFIKHINYLREDLNFKKYAAVHCHSADKSFFVLFYARKAGIKKRILHARTSSLKGSNNIIFKYLFKLMTVRLATDYFACSKLAGKWLFGEKRLSQVKIIQNAIDCNRFKFDNTKRLKLREELKLNDCLVLGHVGRFTYAKNHEFIIEIFMTMLKTHSNLKLLLIGDGPTKSSIEMLVKKNKIDDKVIFSGYKENVEEYLQVMDVLVFPSFFEGLPGVIIEAQVSGLPCVISDQITNEVVITELVEIMSLNNSAELWGEKIINIAYKNSRQSFVDSIIKSGFDLDTVSYNLESFYLT